MLAKYHPNTVQIRVFFCLITVTILPEFCKKYQHNITKPFLKKYFPNITHLSTKYNQNTNQVLFEYRQYISPEFAAKYQI